MSNGKTTRPLCLQIIDVMQKYISLDPGISLDARLEFAEKQTHMQNDAARVTAHSAYVVSQWRKSKQVFRMDRALYDDLIETEDYDIPMTALHLPYPCIYIDVSSGLLGDDVDGCFVLHDVLDEEPQPSTFFSFTFISKQAVLQYSNIFITSLDSAGKTVRQVYDEYFLGSIVSEEMYRNIFLILTYLSADNCDVIENENQKQHYHPGQSIKDAVREIRQWDVGVRYAQTKRTAATHHDTGIIHNVAFKQRPHVRKAHWHLYWTGPGRTIPKVNWIAPCLINANEKTQLPIVIHTSKM